MQATRGDSCSYGKINFKGRALPRLQAFVPPTAWAKSYFLEMT
jgi:hypothetical protein